MGWVGAAAVAGMVAEAEEAWVAEETAAAGWAAAEAVASVHEPGQYL